MNPTSNKASTKVYRKRETIQRIYSLPIAAHRCCIGSIAHAANGRYFCGMICGRDGTGQRCASMHAAGAIAHHRTTRPPTCSTTCAENFQDTRKRGGHVGLTSSRLQGVCAGSMRHPLLSTRAGSSTAPCTTSRSSQHSSTDRAAAEALRRS